MCQPHCGLGMEEHLVKNFLNKANGNK